VTRTDPLRPLHISLSVALLWLAGVLALPGETFTTGRDYAGMAAVASEHTWSIVLAVTGLLGLAGTRSRRLGTAWGIPLRWELLCIAVLALVHLWLAFLVFVANPFGFGTPLFGALGVLGINLLWHRVSHVR
jgi:hypothetical protein